MNSQINQEDGRFESYFRDPTQTTELPLVWAIGRRTDLLEALPGLFSGPRPVVQLAAVRVPSPSKDPASQPSFVAQANPGIDDTAMKAECKTLDEHIKYLDALAR